MRTRRVFLVECSTLAASISLMPAALFGSSPVPAEASIDQIGFSSFSAQLNSVFQIETSTGESAQVHLVESVSNASPAGAPDAKHEKFSLLFQGANHFNLPQNTYWFEHQKLGRFQMFIAPVGRQDGNYRYYEAVFNRPLTAAGTMAARV